MLPFARILDLRCVCVYFEAEFLDVIGPKVLRVFLRAIHSHLYTNKFYSPLPPSPLSKSWLELVCHVNIVYGNLKSENNSQDYAQKPQQRNWTFMNSASDDGGGGGGVKRCTMRCRGWEEWGVVQRWKNSEPVLKSALPLSISLSPSLYLSLCPCNDFHVHSSKNQRLRAPLYPLAVLEFCNVVQ